MAFVSSVCTCVNVLAQVCLCAYKCRLVGGVAGVRPSWGVEQSWVEDEFFSL